MDILWLQLKETVFEKLTLDRLSNFGEKAKTNLALFIESTLLTRTAEREISFLRYLQIEAEKIDPFVHLYFFSTLQLDEHPSPSILFPSSQSKANSLPSPHFSVHLSPEGS
jgi:hypothetical protein